MMYEIYLIEGPGCWYVGSTTRGAKLRFEEHMRGKSGAPKLNGRVAYLGSEAFTVSVLETGAGEPLPAEQHWYDIGIVTDSRECLNVLRPGWGQGSLVPSEVRARISETLKGRVPWNKGLTTSATTRAKQSAAKKGKSHSAEWVANQAAAQRGQKRPAASIAMREWHAARRTAS